MIFPPGGRTFGAPPLCVFIFLLNLLLAAGCLAADSARKPFDVPAGPAEQTLKQFSAQAGVLLVFPTDLVRGIPTHAVRGDYPPVEALEKMLAGTPLIVVRDERPGAFAVRRDPNAGRAALTNASSDRPAQNEASPSNLIMPTVPPTKRPPAAKRFMSALAALFVGAAPMTAQPSGSPAPTAQAASRQTGVLEGRVFDRDRDQYLENARVTIAGTTLEAFTDASGEYRLAGIPAGTATLNVFFTGLAFQADRVEIAANQTQQHNVTMTREALKAAADGTLKLEQYVVTAPKEMSGAAIAINEQRFARNIKTVIAADEFGSIVDGTPGELLKYLPGVAMDSTAGDARGVALDGVQAVYTPVTMNGFDFASASGGATQRTTILDNISINSLSRIERIDSPTPESPGSALAGSINMVPRSAFELSRPTYTGSVFLAMKDDDRHLNKTAGPFRRREPKVTPGFNFSATVPVNKHFGFTVSGNQSVQYAPEVSSVSTWNGVSVATNGTTLPNTTPDKPYMSAYAYTDGARRQHNASLGLTADYRLTSADVLSLSFQKSYLHTQFNSHFQTFTLGSVVGFGPTFDHGGTGTGTISQSNTVQDIHVHTETPTLTYRHNGKVWKSDAGFAYSRSAATSRSADKGFFSASAIRKTGVTLNFDDNYYLRPGQITVTDAAGKPVDPYSLGNYNLNTAGDAPYDRLDARTSAYASLARNFDIRNVPFTLKGGLDVRRQVRDVNATSSSLTYLGPDGRNNTADDSALSILDENYSQRVGPYGFPKNQWTSAWNYYDLYRAHPEYFSAPDQNAYYRSYVTNSKYAREIVSAGYVRADVAFFQRRLLFTGGVRAEQTNVHAEGPLTDPTLNYQRNASGGIIDSNPTTPGIQPVLIVPTTNALGVSQLTFLARQQKADKEYLRYFPSINASFNLRENLILRSAYYYSIGRPDMNQYAGGLTLPDLTSTTATITLNNAGIKPWSANTTKVRLEYYFSGVGQISIGAFRRDFSNFFSSTTFPITPDLLKLYDLDPDTYGNRLVTASQNIPGHVVTNGLVFDYKQALTFLPRWASGLQVFANVTALRTGGPRAEQFAGIVPRVYNWGFSFSRSRYRLNMSWNYRSRTRVGLFSTGPGIRSDTHNFSPKRLTIDVLGEYKLSKHFALTASIRNLNDAFTDFATYNPSTPSYARLRQRTDYSAAWSFGLKATY
jgi:iron complex outermembrane receptor protein